MAEKAGKLMPPGAIGVAVDIAIDRIRGDLGMEHAKEVIVDDVVSVPIVRLAALEAVAEAAERLSATCQDCGARVDRCACNPKPRHFALEEALARLRETER